MGGREEALRNGGRGWTRSLLAVRGAPSRMGIVGTVRQVDWVKRLGGHSVAGEMGGYEFSVGVGGCAGGRRKKGG